METGDLALHQDVTRGRRAGACVVATVLALSLIVVAPQQAWAAPRVTIHATRARVTFGGSVKLFGRIRPAARGDIVRIVDARGREWGRDRTDRDGRYSVSVSPRRRTRYRARWRGRSSPVQRVSVRPRIRVRLKRVRLFGRARVRGVVHPGHRGATVTVRLFRNGRVARKRRVALRGWRYSTRFRIGRPGSYRARATFDDHDHLPARDRSARRQTRLPSLTTRSRGGYVKRLERRLAKLGYLLKRINRNYDFRTADAVRAFHKVQGRERRHTVDEWTWRALARPKRLRPRARRPRFHIEIDQTKQVLFTVRRGRVRRIIHTSTGRGGITRDGVWRVFRKVRGYSPGRLYYPSYFDGLRAIHGWPSVPTSAASHGCARVPMWTAKWIFRRAPIGTRVRIYH